jgi:hypothetical protein
LCRKFFHQKQNKALFGKEQDPEDFTFILKSEGGELQRLYSPYVGRDPNSDNLALKWGKFYTVLEFEGTSLKAPQLDEPGSRFESLSITEINFGYKDPQLAVHVILETSDEFHEVSFPIRFENPQNSPSNAEFKTLLKKDLSKALSLVTEVFEGEGGGGGSSILKLTELPP